MFVRFCLYSILKNLRFFDPFLVIYLRDVGFSYAEVGSMLGCQYLITTILEIPSGVMADRLGRRRTLIGSFSLHAVGLTILAIGAQSAAHPSAIWFFIGLCIYGGGEALREGCHKAIMLDYLESQGQADQSTHVLAVTRMYSKTSSALAGMFAGGLLYFFRDYSALFWLSAATAAAGAVLMMTYPKYLEGEIQRQRSGKAESIIEHESKLITMVRNTRMWPVMLQSIIYESQVDVIIKMFLQPFLRLGLGTAGISLVPAADINSVRGTGALIVGANELFCDGLGAVGARNSAKFQSFIGRVRAMRLLYWATLFTILLTGFCAGWINYLFWPGLVLIAFITLLQNLRRPIYVSELNDVSNKPLRATILSIDNQGSNLATAVLMPLMGLAADHLGLWMICAVAVAIMAIGSVLPATGAEHTAATNA